MRKFKKTCKKAKGLKARIEREKFLDRLKNPAKYAKMAGGQEILARIRARSQQTNQSIVVAKQQPKRNITMDKLRKMAGLV